MAVLIVIVLIHAGLLGLSRWHADEYFASVSFRDLGWSMYWDRVLHWSPRPLSELLVTTYMWAVARWQSALSATWIAILWSGVAAACIVPPVVWGRAGQRAGWLMLGLAIFSVSLMGHPIGELFFWPMGATAYLPTLAATIWLFWSFAAQPPSHYRHSAIALVIATGSSEMGMFLVLCLAASFLVLRLRGEAVALVWLVPGLVVALLVLVGVVRGRVGVHELPGDPALIGHVGPSLIAAVKAWLREAVLKPTLEVWLVRIALMLTSRWVLAGHAGPRDVTPLLAIAFAMTVSTMVVLWAIYFQFGAPCCQRHDAMRACLLDVSFVALGAWSARRWPAAAPQPIWQAVPIPLSLLIMLASHAGDVIQAYASYGRAIKAERQTWQSGLSKGDAMVMQMPPNTRLVDNGVFGQPGRYVLGDDQSSPMRGVLWFFGKRVVSVLPPIQ